MTPRYLLDADICVAMTRRRGSNLAERLQAMQYGTVALSAVVYGELIAGAHKSVDRAEALEAISAIVSFAPILPLGADAALLYGELRATLESEGQVIGRNDLWIAAHALALKATLVTNNTREFRRAKGLKLENWLR